jgi:AbrB family looped-hinge helix DNA binding protein
MVTISTTRMSSKGQVVIPEEIREKLGLHAGTQFAVLGAKGMVILRPLNPPSLEEFKKMVSENGEDVKLD